jgi:hypothetical protein
VPIDGHASGLGAIHHRPFPMASGGHCQINLCRAKPAGSRTRDHTAATAFCHWFAASARKIRSVERETRWR